jgi:5'-3' exonuclease
VFTPNFRYEVAVTKPYKGTRKNPKPFHFYNIMVYLLAEYDTRVARKGVEADDAMCIHQTSKEDTIICSRDKDLRMCPGWHYTWECGLQRAIGPHFTDEIGTLYKNTKGEVIGYGLKFFFYQMLVGDSADNIPGLPRAGKAAAFTALADLTTEDELFAAVTTMYKEKLGEGAGPYFREQADLLWMQQADKLKYKKGK